MSTETNAVDAAESAVESGFDADGNISEENMAAALTGGEVELGADIETDTEAEVGAKPVPEQEVEKPNGDDKTLNDPDAGEGDVPKGVMSKNGESIIPYEDLIKEREGRHAERGRADTLQEQLNAANERLAAVTTPADKDTETGLEKGDTPEDQSTITQAALDEMVEDYPEAGPTIMAIVRSNELLVKQVGDLATQAEETALTANETAHFNAIGDVNKNYEAIFKSEEFGAWIDGMPGIPKAEYTRIFNEGETPEVTSMLEDFLTATADGDKEKVDADNITDVAKKAAEAEAKVNNKENVPTSLTDIPGNAQPHDEQNAMLDMSQGNYMDKMSNLSSADQLALMDKML